MSISPSSSTSAASTPLEKALPSDCPVSVKTPAPLFSQTVLGVPLVLEIKASRSVSPSKSAKATWVQEDPDKA